MPSIPVYGFDELEPSLLNKAKRRVIGLMDMSEEHLTREPQKDPTNGKQNTDVEQLTEVIYNTIKDVEQLSGGLDDGSDIPVLRMLQPNIADTLKPLRPVLKEGAKQLVGINNSLRKINATYDSIQPNMIYTSLKAFIGLVNSVKILKKTTIKFFDILDTLSFKIEEAITPVGTRVVRQPIIEGDTDIFSPVDTSVDVPPILSTQEPFPPLPPAPYDPNPIIPNYEPLPPVPPRPPKKRLPPNLGRKMKEYEALIRKVLTDANIIDPQIATNLDNLAKDKVRNDMAFFTEPELIGVLNQLLTAPSSSQVNYKKQEEDDLAATILPKLPANLTTAQQTEVDNAWQDLLNKSAPDLPTEGDIDDMIEDIFGTSTGTTQQPSTGTPEEEEKQAIKDYETDTGLSATPDVLARFQTISSRDQDDLYQELEDKASKLLNSVSPKQKDTLERRINQAQSTRNVRNNSALETYIEFLEAKRIPRTEIDNAIANANNKKEEREIRRAYDTYLTTASIKTFFKRQERYNQQIYA